MSNDLFVFIALLILVASHFVCFLGGTIYESKSAERSWRIMRRRRQIGVVRRIPKDKGDKKIEPTRLKPV